MNLLPRFVLASALAVTVFTLASAQSGWRCYGGTAQHTAAAPPGQSLQTIRWQTPLDYAPPYSGSSLLIHYGSPIITPANTVIVPVKTTAAGDFRFEARSGKTGALVYSYATDYALPPHNWVPSVSGCLSSDGKLYMPGACGTVLVRTKPDSAKGTTKRVSFYGIRRYVDSRWDTKSKVFISTPLTPDFNGNVYFGFTVTGDNAAGLVSGIAKIDRNGNGTWVSAATAAGDPGIKKVVTNCAPAISNTGYTVYVAVNNVSYGFGYGYLLGLDTANLAPKCRTRMLDPMNPALDSMLLDDGTASPTIGPDGDVYFGVWDSPGGSHGFKGWLQHFDSMLRTAKTPGEFGWDATPSIVPRSAVPSYLGSSRYLLLIKYNDYVGGGGTGRNEIAILDPNEGMLCPNGVVAMREVLTVGSPTEDDEYVDRGFPLAVKEWCINTAAVDAANKCAYVNCEDGVMYKWDFTTNTLAQSVRLTQGLGEAYTPTVVGPDGAIYGVNNAILFACGTANN